MFCLHVCICATCMLSAFGGQKKALEPLELQLQIVLSWEQIIDCGRWKLNLDPLQEQVLLVLIHLSKTFIYVFMCVCMYI